MATASVAAILATTPAAAAGLFDSGDVFASVGNGTVQVYDDNGALLTTLNTGQGGYTTGSVSDTAGNFYVTNFSAGSISKFDNNGGSLGVVYSGLATPESILFNKTGTLYSSQVSGSAIKNLGGGSDVPIGTRSDWIDLAANQTTFLYTQEGDAINQYDTVGGALAPFVSGLGGGNAFAVRILGNGDVLLADNGAVLLFNSAGGLLQSYDPTGGAGGLFSLDVTPDGKNFWSGSFNTADLYEVNIGSGALVQTIATGCGSNCLFGVSVQGEKTVGGGGIPEPATWALMLIGVGAVGASLRGSQRKALATTV